MGSLSGFGPFTTVALAMLAIPACLPSPVATPPATNVPEQLLLPSVADIPIGGPIGEILTNGQEAFFLVCGQSENWVRPSEEEQRNKWWDNLRYATDDPDTQEHILYAWTHNFIMHYGSASLEYDLGNLTGVWTATDLEWQCDSWWRESRLGMGGPLGREVWAEIWVLNYRVLSIKHILSDYVIVVEPTERGFEVIDFQRPAPISLSLTFLTPDGQVVH